MANVSERTWVWLRDEAKVSGLDTQALATAYVIERFMERLMRANHDGAVVVKGGQSLGIVLGNEMRPTKDLDLNIKDVGATTPEERRDIIFGVIKRACLDTIDDGVFYDADSILLDERNHQGDGGYRFTIPSKIHSCKVVFVIDAGVNNEMSFPPPCVRVGGILAQRKIPPAAADVLVYPIENTIAEKLAAKIEDGDVSIRHKDFFDLWLLFETAKRVGDLKLLNAGIDPDTPMPANGDVVDRVRAVRASLVNGTLLSLPEIGLDEEFMQRIAMAIVRTFEHRRTPLPGSISEQLREDFAANKRQSAQWVNWVKNNVTRLRHVPPGVFDGQPQKSLAVLIDALAPTLDGIQERTMLEAPSLSPMRP
ncbi:nucleotidyl transferase AbiEii/AbiGii toxin family protein [Thalassospira xianhensis]|uniref:Nucleotidyl transferase AbiEii/AbiGii toxin family protein n=1 Tax=Thalassospira xianhensis MCCC 1A02616 TaxID=1177929 RepID=A0A367UI52_9PROT|nr:nucleotidyl transferase AbiEii/AbiGii toxin family protein [Thalassospira xianhensis]RCK07700.1 hypothetical protein TH5_01110 [Thalassospira xianhensis MCCC 1A02616]